MAGDTPAPSGGPTTGDAESLKPGTSGTSTGGGSRNALVEVLQNTQNLISALRVQQAMKKGKGRESRTRSASASTTRSVRSTGTETDDNPRDGYRRGSTPRGGSIINAHTAHFDRNLVDSPAASLPGTPMEGSLELPGGMRQTMMTRVVTTRRYTTESGQNVEELVEEHLVPSRPSTPRMAAGVPRHDTVASESDSIKSPGTVEGFGDTMPQAQLQAMQSRLSFDEAHHSFEFPVRVRGEQQGGREVHHQTSVTSPQQQQQQAYRAQEPPVPVSLQKRASPESAQATAPSPAPAAPSPDGGARRTSHTHTGEQHHTHISASSASPSESPGAQARQQQGQGSPHRSRPVSPHQGERPVQHQQQHQQHHQQHHYEYQQQQQQQYEQQHHQQHHHEYQQQRQPPQQQQQQQQQQHQQQQQQQQQYEQQHHQQHHHEYQQQQQHQGLRQDDVAVAQRHALFPSPQAMRYEEQRVSSAEWRSASGSTAPATDAPLPRSSAAALRGIVTEYDKAVAGKGGTQANATPSGAAVLYGMKQGNYETTTTGDRRYIDMKRAYINFLADSALGRPADVPEFCYAPAGAPQPPATAGTPPEDATADTAPPPPHTQGTALQVLTEERKEVVIHRSTSGGSSEGSADSYTSYEERVRRYTGGLLGLEAPQGYGPCCSLAEERVEDELRSIDRRLVELRGKGGGGAPALPGAAPTRSYLELFRRWEACHAVHPPQQRPAPRPLAIGIIRDAASHWSNESNAAQEIGSDYPSLLHIAAGHDVARQTHGRDRCPSPQHRRVGGSGGLHEERRGGGGGGGGGGGAGRFEVDRVARGGGGGGDGDSRRISPKRR